MTSISGDFAQAKSIPGSAPTKSTVTIRIEPDGRIVRLHGRAGRMMRKLVDAGKRGVTTLDLPTGVRVSHYVYLLRRDGFIVSAENESHGGEFPCRHSRYRIETPVTILADVATAA